MSSMLLCESVRGESVNMAKKKKQLMSALEVMYSLHAQNIEMACMGVACMTFVFATMLVLTHYADLDFSSMLTLGGGLQALGFTMLTLTVRSSDNVSGVSAKSLQMYVLVFVFRLSCTLVKDGYVPADKTGDWLYQLSDITSLGLTLQLLYRIHRTNAESYNGEQDTFGVMALLPVCVVLAALTYGDMADSAVFDFAWMLSVLLDTLAMLPQIFLLSRIGGKVDALTSHFVAAIFFSRAATFSFWFFAYPELAPFEGGFNIAGFTIIFLHLIQLVMSGDFMYYYMKSVSNREAMVLPDLCV